MVATAYRGSPTVSAGEAKLVHQRGERVTVVNPNRSIYQYRYLGRTYLVTENVSIKGKRFVTAQTSRR